MKTRTYISFLAVLVALGYKYYIPVPPDFSEPWKTQFYLSSMKISVDLSKAINMMTGTPVLQLIDTANHWLLVPPVNYNYHIKVEEQRIAHVPVRVYRPADEVAHQGTVIFIHGGGWIMGSTDMYHPMIYSMASELNVTFISIDYRLAPTHRYPAGLNDCVAVTKHVLKQHQHHHTTHPVVIMGDSAGGNLAAAVALKLRDSPVPSRLAAQVLIYPTLQVVDFMTTSHITYADAHLFLLRENVITATQYYAFGEVKPALTQAMTRNSHLHLPTSYSQYLSWANLPSYFVGDRGPQSARPKKIDKLLNHKEKVTLMHESFSPLLAANVSGIPDTFIYTALHDVLRDDGVLYVERLERAGVDVEQYIHTAGFHGVWHFYRTLADGARCHQSIVHYLMKKMNIVQQQ